MNCRLLLGMALLVVAAIAAPATAGTGPFPTNGGIDVNVNGTVTPVGAIYEYRYTVTNLTPFFFGPGPFPTGIDLNGAVINKFYIPFFDDINVTPGVIIADPSNAFRPTGWNAQFLSAPAAGWNYTTASDPLLPFDPDPYLVSPLEFQNVPFVLYFSTTTNGLQFGQSGIFGFNSLFPEGNGPVEVGFTTGPLIVDPPIVAGPALQALLGVPEPVTALSTCAALAALALTATRRRPRLLSPIKTSN